MDAFLELPPLDLFPPLRPELFEADFELPLREALEPLRLADDPFDVPAPLEAVFLGAAFFGAAFLIALFIPLFFAAAFFGANLLAVFLGAAFLIALFIPPFFAAAFFGADFFAAAFLAPPFFTALLEPPLEDPLEVPLLEPRLELFEDDLEPLRDELLLAPLDEDLPPELLEADFLVAAFFVDFAILMGFE